jgi:epoxyqueuosine reductase QueG
MTEILNDISPLWGVCPFREIQDNLIKCRALSRLPAHPRSVIIMAFPYLLPEEYYENSNVSKYAVPADYHDILYARLERAAEKLREKYPEEEFVFFADNSPIPEVRAACVAGIGILGKNSLLITEKYGSFVFLGEIVTSMPLASSGGEIRGCLECGECTRACPCGAIVNGKINKELCLSDITQRKGQLTAGQRELIKKSGCIWGCDICQNVCPLNRAADTTDISEFINTADGKIEAGTPVEGRAFGWRGEAVIRRNLDISKE